MLSRRMNDGWNSEWHRLSWLNGTATEGERGWASTTCDSSNPHKSVCSIYGYFRHVRLSTIHAWMKHSDFTSYQSGGSPNFYRIIFNVCKWILLLLIDTRDLFWWCSSIRVMWQSIQTVSVKMHGNPGMWQIACFLWTAFVRTLIARFCGTRCSTSL